MEEVRLDISGISEKDGKKRAYVRFSCGACYAEGHIPECELTEVSGFSDEETEALKSYLRENLAELKKRAAAVNPLNAIMGRRAGE
ncbi:MAG: hypothetical protein IKI75_06765 [Lachnospiraceae bacterium]|nr:hypothetical protein [Lachnospiraceae bacterium]